MLLQFSQLVLAVLVTNTQARIIPTSPNIGYVASNKNADPRYNYGYNINDISSENSKIQHAVHDGNNVKGVYSFLASNGIQRVVHYTADSSNGFNAPSLQPALRPIYPHGSKVAVPIVQPHAQQIIQPAPRPIFNYAPHVQNIAYPPKIAVPTLSGITKPNFIPYPHAPVMQFGSDSTGYNANMKGGSQAPIYVVRPYIWMGKNAGPSPAIHRSPIAINSHAGNVPIVRVPTATLRPSSAYTNSDDLSHHQSEVQNNPAPYLTGNRPIVLGRYGYALTQTRFPLAQSKRSIGSDARI